MNVATITMPVEQAREKLRAYRTQLHKRADAEYEGARIGYEALANGLPLISLPDVFRQAPLDEKHRPRLAVARSDRGVVRFSRSWANATRGKFDTERNGYRGRDLVLEFDIQPIPDGARRTDGRSPVPMIPADVRERVEVREGRRLDLTRTFVLFEVEKWEDVPCDPFLIRHLAGDLYVVLAEWDLTELERAIVSGRR